MVLGRVFKAAGRLFCGKSGPPAPLVAFFCCDGWPELRQYTAEALAAQGVELRLRDPSKSLAEQVKGTHILVPTTEPVPAEAIRACAKTLRLVAQPAAGYDAIAVDVAKELGVPVCVHGGVNKDSVVELTWLLILSVARRLHDIEGTFQAGAVGTPLGTQLCGKTLAVIGAGKIGAKVADVARAFGMDVLTTNSKTTPEELAEVFGKADVVSLHCPLTPATKGMVGSDLLAQMKDGALLVNMARGPVVDYDAVTAALKSGKLGGFGMDVHWVEPADPKDPLYSLPNVVAFPHMGAATNEVFRTMAGLVAEDVRQMLAGEPLTAELKL